MEGQDPGFALLIHYRLEDDYVLRIERFRVEPPL
jgi:hypothetical protein